MKVVVVWGGRGGVGYYAGLGCLIFPCGIGDITWPMLEYRGATEGLK